MYLMKNHRVSVSILGLLIVIYGSRGASAEQSAEEIFGALKDKASNITSWRTDLSLVWYNPETGNAYPPTTSKYGFQDGAVEILRTSGGSQLSRRLVLGADGIIWSEVRFVNKRGLEEEETWFYDVKQMSDLLEVTATLRADIGVASNLELRCNNVPAMYQGYERNYNWDVLSVAEEAVLLRGVLADELSRKWASDRLLREHRRVVSEVELTADPETGLPLKIRNYDHEGALNQEYVFENTEVDIEFDPASFRRRFASSFVDIGEKNGTQFALTGLRALAEGKYTTHFEANVAKRELSMLPTRVAVGDNVADITGPGVARSSVTLADYKGRVVLIDFWATWCGPCVAELPNVIENYQRYRERGFDVIGVSADEDLDALSDFMEDNPDMSWAQICDGKGRDSSLLKRFGIRSIPATILVDAEGVVLDVNLRGEELGQALAKIFDDVSTD